MKELLKEKYRRLNMTNCEWHRFYTFSSHFEAIRPTLEYQEINFVSEKLDFFLDKKERQDFVKNIEDLSHANKRNFYAQHVHYMSFENSTVDPIYINLIREDTLKIYLSNSYESIS